MPTKIRPLADYILIQPVEETKTAGGLYIPATAKKDGVSYGHVRAVGPGYRTEQGRAEPAVKPGDLVMYRHDAGTPIVANNEPHLMLQEHFILCIVQES